MWLTIFKGEVFVLSKLSACRFVDVVAKGKLLCDFRLCQYLNLINKNLIEFLHNKFCLKYLQKCSVQCMVI